VLLLLLLASENFVEGRRRVERRDVVKGVHIEAVPWATGRQSEPGVGRYWRRLHGNFIKEIKVRTLNLLYPSHLYSKRGSYS
jgi:hypothetical protein